MSALDQNPLNPNFLNESNWRFVIKRSPNLNFTVQRLDLPGLRLDAVNTPNPFVTIPVPGDHVTFEHLSVTFKVDEDLNNYLEMLKWILALGFPTDFSEYRKIVNNPTISGESLYSDISVTLLTSQRNPNIEFIFKDAFPVALNGVNLDVTNRDTQYPTCTALFAYTSFWPYTV